MTNDNIKAMGFEAYAGTWGSEPAYDHPPQKKGDGCLFYNFNEEGRNAEFLRKFIPAIDRCFKMVVESDAYETAEKAEHLVNLKLLKKECQRRLKDNKFLTKDHPSDVGIEVVAGSKETTYKYKGKPCFVFMKRIKFEDGIFRIVTFIKSKRGGILLWVSHEIDLKTWRKYRYNG